MNSAKYLFGMFALLFFPVCGAQYACSQSIIVEAETATITDPNDVVLFSSPERIAATSSDVEVFSYDGSGLSGDALMHIGDFDQDYQPVSASGLDYQSYTFNATTAGSYYLYARLVVPSDTNILVADDGEFGGTDGSAQTPINNDSFYLPTDVNIDPETTSPGEATNGFGNYGSDEPIWALLIDDASATVPGLGVVRPIENGTQSETYNIVAGSNTFAWRAREPGLILDTFLFSTDSGLSSLDLDIELGLVAPGGEWGVDSSGNWSAAGNWIGSVPDNGSKATFGSVLTGPATVTNDVNPSLAMISFDNANPYTVSGGTITMESLSLVEVASGAHTISSTIAGTDGLVKSGDGALTLSGSNTYSGDTTIEGNGKLIVSNSSALGAAGNTSISGLESTSQLVLNGVTISGETLTIAAREEAAADAPALVSTSTSTWTGDIEGVVGGYYYNIESQSGTLTLNGNLSAPDWALRTYRLSGAGNGVITGAIVDLDTIGGQTVENVGILKQGTGTWTLATAANVADPSNDENYHHGPTTVEEGTLVVLSNGVNNGELRSSSIAVASGGTLDTTDFSTYSLLQDQALSGAGTVSANTLAGYDDNVIAPGDSVGTLNIAGNLSLSTYNDAPTGSLNYELGSTTTPGGSSNDLISVGGNLSLTASVGTNKFQVNVTPVDLSLAAGSYRLINYTGGLSGSASGANFVASVVDEQGTAMPVRQSLSVNTSTAGQVNLDVSGSAASLVWKGNVNSNWDVNATQNWMNGAAADRFYQLDSVEFDDTSSTQQVVITENVVPAQVTFNNSSDYRFTGTGGLVGGTSVVVNGTGEVDFDNGGNNFSGATTVSGSSSLRFSSSATTGGITNSGKLAVGNASVTAGNPITLSNAGFETDTAPADGATGWTITSGGTDWFTTTAGAPDSTVDPDAASEGVNWLSGNRLVTGAGSSSDPQTIVQLVDISSQSTLIDTGTSQVNLDFMFADNDPNDNASVNITFFSDVAGTTPIGSALASGTIAPTAGEYNQPAAWESRGLSGAVPALARSFQIEIVCDRLSGSAGNVHFDDLSAAIGDGSFGGPAALDVAGDLMLMNSSELELVIASASSFSEVNTTGLLTADGQLSIVTLPGTTLSQGDVFDILDFGSVAGAFDSFSLPSLDTGLTWDTSSVLTTGEISVVADTAAGDFDADGDVDIADLMAWQRGFGSLYDGDDLADWQSSFGSPLGGGTASSVVPEPTSCLLGCTFIVLMGLGRFRGQRRLVRAID